MSVKTKDKKFQLRMFVRDYKLLKALADGERISMSAYVAGLIRQEAKKQGIPDD